MIDKENITGVGVTTLSLEEIIRSMYRSIQEGKKQTIIVTANPHAIVLTREDELFARAMVNADICLPDGVGVVLASRFLGGAIKKRIPGPDFFVKFTDYVNRNGKDIRYFFLGTTEGTLQKIKDKIEQKYPNIEVCGTYAPPFGEWSEDENNRIIELINKRNAHALWVGLGVPKQEKWIEKNRGELDVNVIGAIGAAFDFFAETKRRSPEMFRNAGLEWLPRFLMEPRRLWKRNVISAPKFLLLLVAEVAKKR